MEKDTKKRLNDLIDIKENNNDSEALEFLKSLRTSLEEWGSLTEKQSRALEKIEKLSTPEAQQEAEEWKKEYPKLRKDAVICAKYYLSNPPYFEVISKKILASDSFVPSKDQFEALCRNKYTKRVLQEYYRKPAFARGDLVQIRDGSAVPWHLSKLKQKLCVVIDNQYDLVPSHAHGAKTYKLLPFGKQQTMLCQERWIKSFRNKKLDKK